MAKRCNSSANLEANYDLCDQVIFSLLSDKIYQLQVENIQSIQILKDRAAMEPLYKTTSQTLVNFNGICLHV